MSTSGWRCVSALAAILWCSVIPGEASTIYVAAGGDLQGALNVAKPGDTILLAEGAEFVGNFELPAKTGDLWITIRSAAPDSVLPAAGERVKPANAVHFPRLRSPNYNAALRTAPGAHHWNIRYLAFAATLEGYGDLIQVGDGSSAQNTLAKVPHDIVLSHLYVHGDPVYGQKRCISLNAAQVTIRDSHIAECKGVGLDTQAIGGWNGPGPYLIENNYLEGAGENIMFGGADPAIPNLVADGVTVRRNHIARPMSWRQPIVGTPQGVVATAEAGGSLAAGVYAYRVVARRYVGQGVTGRSTASTQVTATVASDGGRVRVRWQPVAGAAEYWIYGRAAGAQNTYWTLTTTEFVDTGLTGTTASVPTTEGTVWTVKNLFELKNARNVVVEGNVLENHWKNAQPGYSIVLTPRNSQGSCTWCVVEHVRFEWNIIRNVAAGVNLIGYDSAPSRQSNDIVIRHNLFQMSTTLGGNGWFMITGAGPRDILLEHNTVDSNGSTVVSVYGGNSTDWTEVYGWRMIANATRHGTYGINGSYFSYGLPVLTAWYPDHVFAANLLAGGNPAKYPTGNFFVAPFEDQFVDAKNGDYRVRDGSVLKSAAPGGTDVGVDMEELLRRTEGVVGGASPIAPVADFTSTCQGLTCNFTSTSVRTAFDITTEAWNFGDGTSGSGSPVAHTFGAGGLYSVALTVTDTSGLSSTVFKSVLVDSPKNVAPIAAFTKSCVDLACTFTDQSHDPDGRIAAVSWIFGDGTSGENSPAAHSYSAPGTYSVALTVLDDRGASSMATGSVAVRNLLHGAYLSAATKRWSLSNPAVHYWSTDITVAVHGANERPIVGATVSAAWAGAVVKNSSCVTAANGRCTLKSGTLSMWRYWVSLSITGISAPLSDYNAAGIHNDIGAGTASSVKINKP